MWQFGLATLGAMLIGMFANSRVERRAALDQAVYWEAQAKEGARADNWDDYDAEH